MMLKDKYLSVFDVSEIQSIEINAEPERIYPLVEHLDFSKSKIIYCLFKLRGIPVPEGMNLDGLQKLRFVLLERLDNREVIIGLAGKFWTPTGNLLELTPEEFLIFDEPGFAKATWSFSLKALNKGTTLLSTETRVHCLDEKSRRTFNRYWLLIKPFSLLIRREILKVIKSKAETAIL